MNRKNSNQILTLLTLTLVLLCLPITEVLSQARAGQVKNSSGMNVQNAAERKERRRGVPEYWISGTITTPEEQPVANALISANEGATVIRSDMNGSFRVKARSGSFLLVESKGFEPFIYEIRREESDIKFTLSIVPLYTGQDDVINLPLGVQEKQRYIVGAVSGISGENLATYPEVLVSNTLTGQIPGLYAQPTVNGLGNNVAALFSRGHSRSGNNQLVTIVDGVERDIDMLLLEEIQSVQLMKDATSKILYGSRAANGVLSVTTLRSKMHTRKITATYQQGIGYPVAYPTYLNAYQYATMYNEARQNDGLPPMYSPADLEGYRNSSGPNDMRYPNVDYLDFFLRNTSSFNKATINLSGGNENAQYAFVAGYNGNTGLQKVGLTPTRDWFNIRGNLDMRVNDFIKAFVGIAGVFDINKGSSLSHSAVFDRIRDTRSNEFPLIIDPRYIPVDSLGYPGLGASYDRDNNLYGALMYGGSSRQNSVNGQLNLGLNFDLSRLTKGLTAKAQLGFDNFFFGSESLSGSAATYATRWYYDPDLGRDTIMIQQLSRTAPSTSRSLGDSYNLRATSYLLGLDYERTFHSIHRFSANLLHHYMMYETTGTTPNLENSNTALRINYANRDKYIAEFDLALMGSSVFPKENRYFPAFAGGLAWIISEENFLEDNKHIDYLKIKTSAGLLGYDRATDWNLHHNRWQEGPNYQVRQGNNIPITQLVNWASPDLKWEKNREFSIGFEGLLLDHKLWIESNYFREVRSDIIANAGSRYSAVYGGLFGQQNLEKVQNQGIEFELKYMSNAGNLFYSVGINGLWSKNKLIASNEVMHAWENRASIGRPTDNTFGYVAIGLFGKDVPLEGAPRQTLGHYTIGDIAYQDLNGDGIIDENDRKAIGNSFPRFNLGLPIDISWKGWGMNLLCVASLGIKDVVNNSYYWNYGQNNWSDMTLDRYHPVNNPEGTYPRLTTTDGNNNFVNSTFWLHDRSFLRLKNVEVSYTFGYDRPLTSWLKTTKVFLRGTNLLTISKFKKLDPELPNAGVNNYPLFAVYSVGLSATF